MNDLHVGKAANAGHVKIDKQTNYIYETDVQKDSCLKDLYITNPEADKKRIEREKGGLLKDCYSWILYNDNFLQWRDDPEQHLLWVRGDPGKGKTMLLAGLITELEKTSDDGIFYFFCQAARPSHRTASYVLRGVIWLFVSRRPDLKSYVRREYDQAGSNVYTDHNSWYALSGILTAILEDETSTNCIIIIDALDECIEDREKLIGYISQCSVLCKAKWVISSRNWPEIESQLDSTQSQVRLHLELNQASISNAVLKYVNRKVTELNSTYDEPSRELIRKHLLDNANDTFLWVALVCQELEKPGVKHYHSSSILQRFPTGLNELYERMISDINNRDMRWCRAILAVIAIALRPLSLQELAAADGTLSEWVEDEETISSLVASCGSLLTIRENTVYTVHQSVNDFLLKTPKILPSGLAQQQRSMFLGSIKIMQDMLHRNLYEMKDHCALIDDIPVSPSAPLTTARYACIYWVDHFCESLLADDQQQSSLCRTMITQFLETKYLHWLEAMSLLRCTSEAIKGMQKLDKILVGRASDELKLLVKDAVHFAFTHRAIMDVAPLQLYDSALIFTPHLSKIKGFFSREINKFINVFSPDFQHWDACLQTIPGIATHRDADSAICEFSPDGRQFATINSNNYSILLIDASTGGIVKSIESPGSRLHEFAFHPNGESLVLLSGDTKDETKLSIFHLPSMEYSRTFTVRSHLEASFLSFSPDGQLLALASDSHTVDIWDTASGKRADSCHEMPGSYIQYIAWIHTVSHPHALLIIAHDEISIWGLDTRHQTSKLMSLTGIEFPDAATVSRDRTYCAVLHDQEELVLYSWGSSITVQKSIRFDYRKHVLDMSWVADGRSIAFCDHGIEVWDLESKRLVGQVRGDLLTRICYGRNRQLATLGIEDETIKIWSLDRILRNSKTTTQQFDHIVTAFVRSPSGKAAVISNNGDFDMLSITANGKVDHLPKTLQHSLPESLYRPESLAFGQGDYLAVATDMDVIEVFNFNHDTGLYFCERRIREHLPPVTDRWYHTTIQFWGPEQIITHDTSINFWDLKTGKQLWNVSIARERGGCSSTVTADGRIAIGHAESQVMIWDLMRRQKTQCFDLEVLQPEVRFISNISLDSSGILAISAQDWYQNFIAIGNAKDGSWIQKYSLLSYVPTLSFSIPELGLDTGFGVLEYDTKRGSSKDIPTMAAEDRWDSRYLRLSYSKSEAWLMKGSMRIMWIPRQDVDPERFSIQTDLEAGKSTVTLIHDRCLFELNINIDSI